MKRSVSVLLILAVAGILWASGPAENAGKVVLALDAAQPKLGTLGGGQYDPELPYYSGWVAERFRAKTGRELEVREIIATGGQTTTIDMVLASGERLDVIVGYAGRMSKWANAAWAVALSDYVGAEYLKQYLPGTLDPYYRGGKLYALPATAWLQGVNLNVNLVKELGFTVPERTWSLDTYMEMARAAKAKGYHAMVLFATQSSGDYWVQTWLTGFGARLWDDGHVVLNTPEGIAAVKWLVSMLEYAPPGAAGLDYNAMLSGWKSGKVLAAGGSPGGWTSDFPWVFLPPPSQPGRPGKFIVGPDSALVFKTATEVPEAVELVKLLTGVEAQSLWISTANRYPTIRGTAEPVAWGTGEGSAFVGVRQLDIDRWKAAASMVAEYGVWDAGIPQKAYSKVREFWLFLLQSVFLNRATVEEAVAKFQADANAFIDAP